MSKEKQIEIITDLLIDFDEMGFAPTTTCPNPEAYTIKWREQLANALIEYRKQSEKRISNQREELHRLNKHINNLTQSRNAWKKQAEKVGRQLHEVLSKQSESTMSQVKQGEWFKQLDGTHYCSNCGHDATYTSDGTEVCGVACSFCGAHMKGGEGK